MCYCCKSAANAMQGERIEREGDIPICDIPIYRDIERPRDREIGRPRDREIGRPRDWETERSGDREIGRPRDREQKSAGGWKANNRVSIANAP